MSDTLVLLSGGLDSTALLAMEVAEHRVKAALSVMYGQRHAKELAHAQTIADMYGVPLFTADLRDVGSLLTSALTGSGTVPDGHYTFDSMRVTVVPQRNAIMLSVAAGLAWSLGATRVVTAVHAGDHAIYPDCRPKFIEAMDRALSLGALGYATVRVEAPFVGMDKAAIVRAGAAVGAPFHLSWSCYQGGTTHCGRCGTCVERAEAFRLAGVPDPTTYIDPEFWVTVVDQTTP